MRMDDQDIIIIGDQRYIRSGSSLADDRRHVLLSGDTFAVFDRSGDFQPVGSGEFGLFHCDTRYLSAFELRMNGQRPLLLSSSIRDDNAVLAVDLTNSEMRRGDQLIRHGTVHIYRSKFLRPAYCFERIRVENYGTETVELTLASSSARILPIYSKCAESTADEEGDCWSRYSWKMGFKFFTQV
jgi:glycogen debranching enzyme